VARDDASGETRLLAYLTAAPGAELPTPLALRAALAANLPEAMIPSAWARLPSLPLTSSGKLDHSALPVAHEVAAEVDTPFVAPRSALELTIAQLVGELLSVPRVGIHDNFFHLGGHSLLAVRFTARLHDAFGVDVPLRTLFESPTVAGLAAEVQRRLAQPPREQSPIRKASRDAYRRRAVPAPVALASTDVSNTAPRERAALARSPELPNMESPADESQEADRASGSSWRGE
jgi:acyl carrier protein